MFPHPIDLFGEVPVTHDDLDAWCELVRFSSPVQWRRDWYIKNWDVAGKVRRSKLDGSWYLG